MTDTTTPLTVRFARRPRRGLLLGLSAPRVVCLALALAILIPALFTTGAIGAAITLPVWGGLIAAVFIRVGGRVAVEAAPTAAHYLLRRVTGQTRYRVRPGKPRPAGTLALPGDAAAVRFLTDGEGGPAILHDPHAQTLTVAGIVSHPAYVLLSSDEQARRVHAWGRALAAVAGSGTGTRLQILELTLPDAGRGITGWWDSHRVSADGTFAAVAYEELMRTCVVGTASHRTLIALSLDLRKSRHWIRQTGRGLQGAVAFLRQEMASLEAGMRAAELCVGTWLDESDLAATLRTAYDPGFGLQDPPPTANLATAGPVAVDEHWDHLRHDTAYSAVLWVSEWPRVGAPTFFLHALVFQPGIRKTLSLTMEPVAVDAAMRDIRKAKVEYATEAAQKAKIGAIADLSDSVEREDVADRERALIAGHADIRFTGLLTITAPTREELEGAVAEVSRAAIQCGCETRRLNGQQARAFTAGALPLARKLH